ncbi:MAG: N-Acetyl-D-glucosamine ABC transport system, permease protein 2 [Chloroflexi bacterium AL-W]|nr:N-Acetyl-D-glucosamine ABC transport system, permease protein 2 [Chloroflexi bacterium AL-N1]NOK65227.1 N-Acetyl-D-glucosamine ABC transport system, permease protein 2 [Chloroflexi bacterium AL-N10]NOK72508.1 N-Acetyl-D-glucosamine ABC transport system, permease protein 2 [Chloroflexi bacterium AL-N5]NOK79406.1 N-Acetyl-D-glucosamine ABC transport system, permease protein 2 [Chloroflexi bacterium AL-W]NOK87322.1 N-Acetyl-D-glucosamine ABC transport system, permease protein 2 [Chloroflexi bac
MQTDSPFDSRTVSPKRSLSRRAVIDQMRLVGLEIVMILLVISFLVPTLWMISSSLKVSTEIFVTPITWIPQDPQWSNYVRIFEILPLMHFIYNTVLVVFFAVLGTVISSALVAYAFARLRWPGRETWFALLLATIMLPEVITLVPRFVLFRNFGWIDTFLPLIVPYWTATTAIYVFLMRQFFRGIPMELEDAALIDGASRLRVLFQIILPLSKPAIATVAVFALIQHYNDFVNPLIYINSQDNWTLALAVRAYNDAYVSNWELVFAASTVMLVPVVILFLIAQRYFVQGITTTGFGGR